MPQFCLVADAFAVDDAVLRFHDEPHRLVAVIRRTSESADLILYQKTG